MDPLLPKYLIQSLAEYFRPIVSSLGIEFFVDTIDEEQDDIFQKDSCVLRMDGPILQEGSKDVEWYKIEIQLLLTDIRQSKENAFNIYEWAGTLQKALQDPIPIFQIAEEEIDDVLINCLAPDKSVRNNIRVVNFFAGDTDLRVRQMSIQGKFTLCPLGS